MGVRCTRMLSGLSYARSLTLGFPLSHLAAASALSSGRVLKAIRVPGAAL